MSKGLTISMACDALRSGKTSSVELTKDYLSNIKKSDLNAFVTVDEKGALKAAAVADQAIKRSQIQPLTGIPLAIKDVI